MKTRACLAAREITIWGNGWLKKEKADYLEVQANGWPEGDGWRSGWQEGCLARGRCLVRERERDNYPWRLIPRQRKRERETGNEGGRE